MVAETMIMQSRTEHYIKDEGASQVPVATFRAQQAFIDPTEDPRKSMNPRKDFIVARCCTTNGMILQILPMSPVGVWFLLVGFFKIFLGALSLF